MQTTKSFAAKAHTRENYKYSDFHQQLLHENPIENYALKHIYSVENCRHLLNNWGWSNEEIKQGCDRITIDVREKTVYLHIPNTTLKRNKPIKIRGLSRYVKKADFVDTLIFRTWSKADPYKLEPGNDWDELIAQGNTGDFYELNLTLVGVTCTCQAFQGLIKAFKQDAIAKLCLQNHFVAQGQIPDKHVFAVWKYLNAENLQQYQFQLAERQERFLEEKYQNWDLDLDLEIENEEIEF